MKTVMQISSGSAVHPHLAQGKSSPGAFSPFGRTKRAASLPSTQLLRLPGARTRRAIAGSRVVQSEDVEFAAGGAGGGRKFGGGGGDWRGKGEKEGTGAGGRGSGMGAYYREMLQADPGNALLLRNYGKFLHEVEGDVEGAEECYGRAILASPNDGEVLSLYGKLIWDEHRDGDRAEAYFERAVETSPDDCYVLGSYAHFLWDAEEETASSSSTAPPSSHKPQHLVSTY